MIPLLRFPNLQVTNPKESLVTTLRTRVYHTVSVSNVNYRGPKLRVIGDDFVFQLKQRSLWHGSVYHHTITNHHNKV